MSTINEFVTWATATRPKLAGSVDKIQNEATKYRTYLFRKMLKGLSDKMVFQAGSTIVDYIMLGITSSYADYQPTDSFTYTSTGQLTKIECPWRFSKVHSVVTDHELELQGSDEKTVFKKIRDVKETEMSTSQWEGYEDSLWATPVATAMEVNTGIAARTPYSIGCFVTKDGLAPSTTNSYGLSGATAVNWTTVMQVDPTTAAYGNNWKNQYETYNVNNIDTELLTALDNLWIDVQFESPQDSKQYFEDTRLSKLTIPVSKKARTKMVALAAERNDNLAPRNNLHMENSGVSYNGIPLMYIGALDTVDSSDDALGKFNFRFLNFNYIRPLFHSKRFNYPIDPPITAAQPTVHVMIRDTWRNLWCQSRRQQGMASAA